MKKNLALSALLATGFVMSAQEAKVTIRLVNSAKVASGTLARAQEQANHVLARAGIELMWRDCSTNTAGPCTEELRTGDFWLHVANWKPARTSADLLGFMVHEASPGGSRVAGVYHPMVVQMETALVMEEATILGAALAHEIGHLLGAGHSLAGVMRAGFTKQDMDDMERGGLLFGDGQAVRMRSVVARPDLGQPERLRVGIRVIDQAGVSPEVMQQATHEASHILRQAGVEADWLDCPLGEQSSETRRRCNQRLGPTEFWLHLAIHKLPGAGGDNLGAALLEKAGGGVAYAYFRDIENNARDWRCDTSLVLATVMAHEIGHLLLGDAHSRTGIMSAGLNPHSLALAKQGFLLFTPTQARMIRSNLSGAPQRAIRGILRN